MALIEKLNAIGDAIREKTGGTELLTLEQMPAAIGSIETGGGGETFNELNYSGQYFTTNAGSPFAHNILNNMIDGKNFTINLTNMGTLGLFYNSTRLVDLSKVVINIDGKTYGTNSYEMFAYCRSLEHLPKLNVISTPNSINMSSTFNGCDKLKHIDEDFWSEYWKQIDPNTTELRTQSQFCGCLSLRQLPDLTMFNGFQNDMSSMYNQLYYDLFASCRTLDTIEYVPVIDPTNSSAKTNNLFNGTFSNCSRVKDIIFATDNGTPYVRNWSNQSIILDYNVGWTSYASDITSYGITADKQVKDDATYAALKNDPDWFATKVDYSRYNHDSAIRTINSLPDCSSGSSNTITFKGTAGSKTDGGAINTLTEAEIAVAAAKGWTVSLA